MMKEKVDPVDTASMTNTPSRLSFFDVINKYKEESEGTGRKGQRSNAIFKASPLQPSFIVALKCADG